jgi:endonuclease YncB( thermonuclease family)
MQTIRTTAFYSCISKLLPVLVAVFIACLSACNTSNPIQISTELASTSSSNQAQQATPLPDSVDAKVTRVIDGDTIVVDIGGRQYKVRYIGMDTPETVHPFKPVQYFGKEACEMNSALLKCNEVRLERDVSGTDKYGRLLRYVWVGDLMVNAELV